MAWLSFVRSLSRPIRPERRVLCMSRGRDARVMDMPSYLESLAFTCDLLRRHVDGARPIGPSDDIQSDLGLDSLAMMELVSEVENRFGVFVPADMVEHVVTVDDVARLVQRLKLG